MLKISESYLVGVDVGLGDEPCVTVVKREDHGRLKVVKTIFGEEAEALYEALTDSPLIKRDETK